MTAPLPAPTSAISPAPAGPLANENGAAIIVNRVLSNEPTRETNSGSIADKSFKPSKAPSAKSTVVFRDGLVNLYAPLQLPSQDLLGEVLGQSALQKRKDIPSLHRGKFGHGPANEREALFEVPIKHEAHLQIPVKQYPGIDWKLIFGGDGSTLSPLTIMERETGAAVLLRTIKRSIKNKPDNYMYPVVPISPTKPLAGEPSKPSGHGWAEEYVAFQKARIQHHSLSQKNFGAANKPLGPTTGSPNVSNMALPPTPQNEPLGIAYKTPITNMQVPTETGGDEGKRVVLAEAISKIEKERNEVLDAVMEEEAALDAPGGGKKEDNTNNLNAAAQPLGDITALQDTFFLRMQVQEEERLKRREALMNELGLHFWITGATAEEVADGQKRLELMISHSVEEYKRKIDEDGYQPASEIKEDADKANNAMERNHMEDKLDKEQSVEIKLV